MCRPRYEGRPTNSLDRLDLQKQGQLCLNRLRGRFAVRGLRGDFCDRKSQPRILDVLGAHIDRNPATLHGLGDESCRVGPSERIEYKVVRVRQEVDEEPRQLSREPSRVNPPSVFFQQGKVVAVALVVAAGDQVAGNRSALVLGERLLDVVSGRPSSGFHPSVYQSQHVLAVRLQHSSVVGFRIGRLTQPIDVLDTVLHPYPTHVHPFGGCRHLRRVVPEELLAEREVNFVTQMEEKSEVV